MGKALLALVAAVAVAAAAGAPLRRSTAEYLRMAARFRSTPGLSLRFARVQALALEYNCTNQASTLKETLDAVEQKTGDQLQRCQDGVRTEELRINATYEAALQEANDREDPQKNPLKAKLHDHQVIFLSKKAQAEQLFVNTTAEKYKPVKLAKGVVSVAQANHTQEGQNVQKATQDHEKVVKEGREALAQATATKNQAFATADGIHSTCQNQADSVKQDTLGEADVALEASKQLCNEIHANTTATINDDKETLAELERLVRQLKKCDSPSGAAGADSTGSAVSFVEVGDRLSVTQCRALLEQAATLVDSPSQSSTLSATLVTTINQGKKNAASLAVAANETRDTCVGVAVKIYGYVDGNATVTHSQSMAKCDGAKSSARTNATQEFFKTTEQQDKMVQESLAKKEAAIAQQSASSARLHQALAVFNNASAQYTLDEQAANATKQATVQEALTWKTTRDASVKNAASAAAKLIRDDALTTKLDALGPNRASCNSLREHVESQQKLVQDVRDQLSTLNYAKIPAATGGAGDATGGAGGATGGATGGAM